MHVAIDQAGEHGGAAEIDDLSAGRNRNAIGWADGCDAVALNQDDLVLEHRARFGIEQPPGADGDAFGRSRSHVHVRGVEGSGFRACALGVESDREDKKQGRKAVHVLTVYPLAHASSARPALYAAVNAANP